MRLIDEDELADYITENEDDFLYALEHKDRGLLETIIALIPTAYNIDKVVEKLEMELKASSGYSAERVSAFRRSIEIVKEGGKNEDV